MLKHGKHSVSSSRQENETLWISLRFWCSSAQAVHKLDERNIVSPIFAATMGSPSQLGMSWTHVFTSNGKHFLFPVCSNFTVLCIFQSFFSKLPSLYRHSDVCFREFYLLFSLSFLVPSCYNWIGQEYVCIRGLASLVSPQMKHIPNIPRCWSVSLSSLSTKKCLEGLFWSFHLCDRLD
jgi:hypothetical protein